MHKPGFLGQSEWRHGNTQYMLSRLQKETNVTRTRAGKRKLRLFACGCCRLLWDLLPVKLRKAVEVAERFADGQANSKQLEAARQQVEGMNHLPVPPADDDAAFAVAAAAGMAIGTTRRSAFDAAFDVLTTSFPLAGYAPDSQAGDTIVADLLCCVFGAYVHPPGNLTGWSSPAVFDIACTIYSDRDFDRLPILADALEDAGCDRADILAHCRQPGVHVRGCWCVDLLLGKS